MVDKSERSLEQVYRSAVNGLYARLRSNYDFLYRKFGNEGIKLITDMSREFGLSIAERVRKRLRDNSLDSVAGYILRIFDTISRDRKDVLRLIKEGDSKIIIEARECPLRFTSVEMCLAHTTMEKTVVEELNPKLVYRIGRSIPAGDVYCEHIIEIRTLANKSKLA
jgi:hypothetical protein